MEKLIAVLFLFILISGFRSHPDTLSKADRKTGVAYLQKTLATLQKKTKNLNADQLNFRPEESRWSIKDNLEHLIEVELIVRKIVQDAIQAAEVPEDAVSNVVADEKVIGQISTRQQKYNAPPVLQPKGKYDSFETAFRAWKNERKQSIRFLKGTDLNLRAYYSKNVVVGWMDTYQWMLFVSAHTERHLEQIDDILANEHFPN